MLRALWILPFLWCHAFGNVEKIVFVAPAAQALPNDASIDNLLLSSLSEIKTSVRTYVNASFPTEDAPRGAETWVLLEGLTAGRRYEVRICWLATQPTSFWLYTHSLQPLFDDPSLLSSLSSYSYARHASLSLDELHHIQAASAQKRSASSATSTTFLFLQVFAAADYFTLNKTLMANVPPVHADIILDPYLLNVFPRSLLPTAIYLIIIAVVGWLLSGWIWDNLVLSFAGRTSNSGIESKKDD